jgi:hypothetical protein
MSYSVSDLITIFRREVDDPSYYLDRNLPQPNTFWSNFELIQYIDQGQKEFAERTLVFKDSLSFRPSIEADDPWVYFDPRILRIERAELSSSNKILPVYTIEDFQTKNYIDDYGIQRHASWEEQAGTPRCLIRDLELDKLRLYPTPEEDDTLILSVRRYPMEDITTMTDKLEIPNNWQFGLLYKIRKEAFVNPKALMAGFGEDAAVAKKDWEDFLNKAESRIKIKTRGPGQVRYRGL